MLGRFSSMGDIRVGSRRLGGFLCLHHRNRDAPSAVAFVFGLIIVFLVLAAQCESWTLSGAVMTAEPFGVLGGLLARP